MACSRLPRRAVRVELAGGEAERAGVPAIACTRDSADGDIGFAELFERVGRCFPEPEQWSAAEWEEVELLLMEGYAQTLALESERMAIEQRLAEKNFPPAAEGRALPAPLPSGWGRSTGHPLPACPLG